VQKSNLLDWTTNHKKDKTKDLLLTEIQIFKS
jgi:hypothetical protein